MRIGERLIKIEEDINWLKKMNWTILGGLLVIFFSQIIGG